MTTWYFNYRPFDQHGLAVELTDGRVSAVYTLWQPAGWRDAAAACSSAPCRRQVTKRTRAR